MNKNKNQNQTANSHNERSVQELFKKLLSEKYQPTPDGLEDPSEAKVFRSSLELMHDFRDTCDISMIDISWAMLDMEYKSIPIGSDRYLWILYDKNPEL